ncbi:hypothetical protein ACP4J4_02675 [Aureimonas ureilytica]|uniref:hypothetical protein n=1 Tax=Aureimonas ureilytica TaxID=401562 RepID=UPI003CE9E50B
MTSELEAAEKAPYRWEAKPETLEAKFKLLSLLPYYPASRRKHALVLGFVLDWFHSKYGNALASVRHIVASLQERDPHGKGLFTGDVHSALSDLVDWGFLDQEKGSGRRASRYVPNWGLLASVRQIPNTNVVAGEEFSVRENQNASVRESPNATDVCVREIPNEDPSTRPGLQIRGLVVGNEFDAAASPPHAPGPLGAVAAGPASGGFDAFWSLWPRKHGKANAKAAWSKLAPEPSLQEAILIAAHSWAEHYAAHSVEKKWIPEPANWLVKERWDEDLPLIHVDGKGASIAKAKANSSHRPANVNHREARPSPFTAEIVDSEVRGQEDCTALILRFSNDQERSIWIQHKAPSEQEEGQKLLADLIRVVGLDQVSDSSELHGQSVRVVPLDANRFRFEEAA